MKKILSYTLILLAGVMFFSSCDDDDPSKKSIFDTTTPELTQFDKWLRTNYVAPYNVEFIYRLDDREIHQDYNVSPVSLDKAIIMAKLLKHLWYEAYDEVAGVSFMKANSPRILHLIGTAEYDPDDGTIRLGVAEGGIKITITMANELDVTDMDFMNEYFFNTMHHEFAHILHQTKNYPQEFNLISVADYSPTGWYNRKNPEDYAPLGFVTAYASKEAREDFVETISNYIVRTDQQWTQILAWAGATGEPIIQKKLEFCRRYMADIWSVDLDKMREVVQRRQGEIDMLDFDSLIE